MESSHQDSFDCRKQKVEAAELNGGLRCGYRDVRHVLGETGRMSGVGVAPSSFLLNPTSVFSLHLPAPPKLTLLSTRSLVSTQSPTQHSLHVALQVGTPHGLTRVFLPLSSKS